MQLVCWYKINIATEMESAAVAADWTFFLLIKFVYSANKDKICIQEITGVLIKGAVFKITLGSK